LRTTWVLYACTHTERIVAAHSLCAGTDPARRSLCTGELTGWRIFSRDSASISGAPKWTASNSYFFARVSVTARCSTLSVPARHTFTFTPYFSSNGLMIVGRSFSAIVV